MRAAREVGVHREPVEGRSGSPRWRSARRSSSSRSGRSGPRSSPRTSRPTSTRPATRAGSAATRWREDDPLAVARGFLGTPYVWGGLGREGIDCSGLVHLAYRSVGVRVPRDAADQAARAVPVQDPQPGDLYFFGSADEAVGHVGFVTEAGCCTRATGSAWSRSRCPRSARATLLGAGRLPR